MNCPNCGLLIGHGTMGTVTPLCQCTWNQKILVGGASKGREVAELLQQLAEYKQRAEAAEAKLRELEWQPIETAPVSEDVLVVCNGKVMVAMQARGLLGGKRKWYDRRSWVVNPTLWARFPSKQEKK